MNNDTETALTTEERHSLLRAWPWPQEAATTRDGFPNVASAVERILAARVAAAEAAAVDRALAKVRALAEEATERSYGQIAADKMLTILPTEHGAKVPPHWRDEAEAAAAVPVTALRAAVESA